MSQSQGTSPRHTENKPQNMTLWPMVHQMPPNPPRCYSWCLQLVEVLMNTSTGTCETLAHLPGVCNSPGHGRL